ncbi:ATP synthase subunit C [Candidatus Hecatella orcuttiae]|jgi:F0F1-type ATP synthase membrane subunit c/vacuolar-type H+-ATPase subunit K|uniref:ATP synthase subunit C n=1 Tax=Candidatus Hecatella orcuttiae TaxID=1935119 RepID=UPI002867EEB0|nr:ATP synthase subunit C [Candidatus Hecatella orcuttiae]
MSFHLRTAPVTVLLIAMAAAMLVAFASAQETPEAVEAVKTIDLGLMAIGAGIAIAVPGLGAALGLSMAVSAIAAAGAERPEIIGRFFIFVVFIEAIAIYALIVAIFIILMLPAA